MTFWVKNVSGSMWGCELNGATGITPGAQVDLESSLDGQSANTRVSIQASTMLATAVLVDGSVALLANDGSTVLSAADAAAKLRSADGLEAATADGLLVRKPWVAVAPNPGNNTPFDVVEFDVPDGRVLAVDVKVFVRAGTDADMDVGSSPIVFTARRRTGESVHVPRQFRADQSEGGIRFDVDARATSVAITARRRGLGTVMVSYAGTAEVQP